MFDTMTITSKENPISPNIVSISSLFDTPIETITIFDSPIGSITIPLEILRDVFETIEIDDEMHDIEDAAIYDFLKFEAVD